MRFLLTLILVALATPAAAQISAGPTGERFAIVDDNGKLLGGFDFTGSSGKGLVLLSTPHVSSQSAKVPIQIGWLLGGLLLGLGAGSGALGAGNPGLQQIPAAF